MQPGPPGRQLLPGTQPCVSPPRSLSYATAWPQSNTDIGNSTGHAALTSSMSRLEEALLAVSEALQRDDLD